jgi:hypothetical protein
MNYYDTQEETMNAANQARLENSNTHTKKSSIQCDCGESFAVFLIDDDTLNTLQTFVECEACNFNN